MRQQAQVEEQVADVDLAALATAGDIGAFEELYRRHVEAAWRMALAVTSNPHDAADAVSDAFTRVFQALPERPQAARHFLPYLLAAVRNSAIDGLRRNGRRRAADGGDVADWASLVAGPGDRLEADAEAVLVARAFRNLPERWRSVLWLTEVEGIAARDVAVLLGMTPNGVAQLAARARAGLRQRYLQAHLRQSEVRTSCRETVGRLGAYAAGGLAPRDVAKVDQHLAGCEACRSRLAQLQDVAPSLRRAVLPLPVGLAALSAAKLELGLGGVAGGVAASATTAVPGIGAGLLAAIVPAPVVAGVASAALLVAGFVGAGAMHRAQRDAPPVASAPAPPPAPGTFATASGPAPAAPIPQADPVMALVDETARAAGLTDVADLMARLGRGLADTSAALAAAVQGDVRIDVGAAVADVDLREGSHGCSFQVLGVELDCSDAGAAVAPAPGERSDTPTPAPPLLPDGLVEPQSGPAAPAP